jgi:hypothetical protein
MSRRPHGRPEWPWRVYATAKRLPRELIAYLPTEDLARRLVRDMEAIPDGWLERLTGWLIGFQGFTVERAP